MNAADIDDLVSRKTRDLLTRSESCAWTAMRSYLGTGLRPCITRLGRGARFFNTIGMHFSLAMLRCIDRAITTRPADAKLESFDIEDDGSAEWSL